MKKEAEDILFKLMEYQTLYYKLHKDQITNNVSIKQLYVAYNKKLRSYNKKLNKLKEGFESVNVRLALANANSEENIKLKEIIRITEKEIDFHRKILRLRYDETDLERFKQEKMNRDGNINTLINLKNSERKTFYFVCLKIFVKIQRKLRR